MNHRNTKNGGQEKKRIYLGSCLNCLKSISSNNYSISYCSEPCRLNYALNKKRRSHVERVSFRWNQPASKKNHAYTPPGGKSIKKNKQIKRLVQELESLRSQLEKKQGNQAQAKHGRNAHATPEPHPFYGSAAWRSLRYMAIKVHGRKCQACYATDKRVHVDHIEPRSKRPDLELTFSNLQVLCEDCNLGKSNKDSTDWRMS